MPRLPPVPKRPLCSERDRRRELLSPMWPAVRRHVQGACMSARRRLARILPVVAIALGFAAPPALADTIAPAELIGWWLSVDNVLPQSTQTTKKLPAEELLVIDAS